MSKLTLALAVCLSIFGIIPTNAAKNLDEASVKHFSELMKSEWIEVFNDSCTEDWKSNWTLDGENATVTNSKDGMNFSAGPEAFNDAHHAVLWTKMDFKNDLKIEYEYTRLDKELRMVTILYILATGSGEPGFDKDIGAWAEKRTVPSMNAYFNNMNTYHISYAAFGTKNTIPGKDYIRARRYMCNGLKGTVLENEYENTGFFEPGIPHKITVIKHGRDIYMNIRNDQKEMLCHFINSKYPTITEGKIGLRHMYTRAAQYKNFKVSILNEDKQRAISSTNQYKIQSLEELSSRIKNAKAGDILVLPDRRLKDWTVDISVSGTPSAPITIKGQGSNKTIFTGRSAIKLNGASYVHIKDFSVSNNTETAVRFQSTQDCSVSKVQFDHIEAKSIIKIEGEGKRNQVSSCHFFNNPSKNIVISINGPKSPVETIIRNNLFEDVPPIGGNGRETIQIGQSQTVHGQVKTYTLVENNRFVRCNGEAEIISNKSSSNNYIGNLFLDCEGSLVMRGGSGCSIENNRLENCAGGIRVSGKNHNIKNNVIWNSRDSAIKLMYGVSDEPPAFYQAVSGCRIENNTIVNAKEAGILIGDNRGQIILKNAQVEKKLKGNPQRYGTKFDMTIAPYNNTIQGNVVFNQHGTLITAKQAPQNTFKNNRAYSPQSKVETDDRYQFARLQFVDLEAGNLALKATNKETTCIGASGRVCDPVDTEQIDIKTP